MSLIQLYIHDSAPSEKSNHHFTSVQRFKISLNSTSPQRPFFEHIFDAFSGLVNANGMWTIYGRRLSKRVADYFILRQIAMMRTVCGRLQTSWCKRVADY